MSGGGTYEVPPQPEELLTSGGFWGRGEKSVFTRDVALEELPRLMHKETPVMVSVGTKENKREENT